MKGSFFRSMTWLHTWGGLLACWLLFVVFFGGTLSYFRYEISWWMQPESHGVVAEPDQQQAVQQVISVLQSKAPDSPLWFINLADERNPLTYYGYREAPQPGQKRGRFVDGYLVGDSQQDGINLRDTKGGDFFYRLHFDLHYMSAITARWIVGAAAMIMLVGLVTGIVIHRRIFADFFTFRNGKGARTWLDLHNVSSVLALPYHLMITYTGLLTLMFLYMSAPVDKVYPGGRAQFFDDQNPTFQSVKAAGQRRSEPLPIQDFIQRFKAEKQVESVSRISINNPADENTTVTVYGREAGQIAHYARSTLYNSQGDALGSSREAAFYAPEKTANTLIALHTAKFAPWPLRWLFVLGGVLGCIMVASGGVLWARRIAEKRLKANQPMGWNLRLVQALNIATVAGLPLASLVFLYLNRLLAADFDGRREWEMHGFFICYLLVFLFALYQPGRRGWAFVWMLTGGIALALPLLNLLTTDYHLLAYLINGQWALAGLELIVLAGGLIALWGARHCLSKPGIAHQQNARPDSYKVVTQ
ncbi:PepSY-associated TM helix domain-containing protein [Bowmanella denitrificans]|uniref:PepSY-associated TM helix domain-containing protein n=1 Tax=Bowmanella denitrificans TaxID=366582 RepID=A0ABN0WKN5_9ALTE